MNEEALKLLKNISNQVKSLYSLISTDLKKNEAVGILKLFQNQIYSSANSVVMVGGSKKLLDIYKSCLLTIIPKNDNQSREAIINDSNIRVEGKDYILVVPETSGNIAQAISNIGIESKTAQEWAKNEERFRQR